MSARDVIALGLIKIVRPFGLPAAVTIGDAGAAAILSALEAAGYAVVPKEPTEEMYLAMLCQLPDTAFSADIKKALASVIRVGAARPSDVCEWEKNGAEYYEYRTSCGVLTPGPSSHCYTCRRPVKIAGALG